MKQIFLEVKRVCFYNIQYTLNFNSIYSKRMYYYLKLYEDTGFRIDNLDQLKEKLECPAGYKNFSDFKRFVINPAYEEINGNSDISFEYEEIKTGRKVTNIKFFINSSNVRKKILSTRDVPSEALKDLRDEKSIENVNKIIKSVLGIDINNKACKNIYISATKHRYYGNAPLELIRLVAEYSKTQNIRKDLVAWLATTVSNYEKPITNFKKNKSDDCNERSYDYEALEKKLLGWQ